MRSLRDVIHRFRAMRAEYASVSASVDGVKIMDLVLHEVEQAESSHACEAMSLADASRESGYSVAHLSRMVRTGVVPNAGRKGKPLVRVGDLPKRPGAGLTVSGPKRYDPDTDARNLLSRNGGHNASNEAA
jgi:hypothetical protein